MDKTRKVKATDIPKKKKRLSDERFIIEYIGCDCVGSELARKLKLTKQAVSARVVRLRDQIEQAQSLGNSTQTAAVLDRTIVKAVMKDAEREVMSDLDRQYTIFDHLEELFVDMKVSWTALKGEMQKRTEANREFKPYHIDQQCKLVARLESLAVNAHKIKLDLVNAKGTQAFIEAVTRLLMKEIPEVREKLYVELSQLGVEGQTALFTQGRRSGPGGDGDSGGPA